MVGRLKSDQGRLAALNPKRVIGASSDTKKTTARRRSWECVDLSAVWLPTYRGKIGSGSNFSSDRR